MAGMISPFIETDHFYFDTKDISSNNFDIVMEDEFDDSDDDN